MAKADKAISIIPYEKQPHPLPGNWCWVSVNSINQYKSGSIDPTKQPDSLFELYSVPSSTDDYPEIVLGSDVGSTKQTVEKGDVLLCKINPRINRVWKVTQHTNNTLLASSEWIIIRNRDINPDYLMYCFKSPYFREYMLSNVSGVGGSLMRAQPKYVKNYPIPIPPLAEQHRIVSRIESLFAKLDEAKEKAQAVVDGFEDRKAAILHKAFIGELTKEWRNNNRYSSEELYKTIQDYLSKVKKKNQKKVNNDYSDSLKSIIPNVWVFVDLDSISTQITDGEHKTPNRIESYCGFYLLSARNILNDRLVLDDVDYIDEAEYSVISKRCNPKRGDVLLSCSGSVGRCCVVNDDNRYSMVRSAAMISPWGCNSRFIMYMIQSDAVQKQIRSLSKQTAQANLFLGAIASLMIPLPSKEEQDELVRRLDNLIYKSLQAKEAAEQIISQIDIMKKSILARAFRGELGTNDPTDESAEELLKRFL